MFIMFLHCASYVMVVSPTLAIKLWLENHIFTFLTSAVKQGTGGTLYYARRLPNSSPSKFVKITVKLNL